MKNISIVNKVIAKKLNKPLSLITTVNHFYWKTSREKLTSIEPVTIFLKNIGSITISKHKLYGEIKRLINKIRKTKTYERYNQESKDKIISETKIRLTKLLYHRNIIAQDEYDQRVLAADRKRIKESQTNQ